MTQAEKQAIIAEYATHEGDTGSPEVQIAILSARIANLTEHLKYIWLCHLSRENNPPELAYKTVEWELRGVGIIPGKDLYLAALKRTTPSELFVFE